MADMLTICKKLYLINFWTIDKIKTSTLNTQSKGKI